MAVITLCSASGSPGVTTTALGLALLWPRPVLLVDADPTGGSGILAGFYQGMQQYEVGTVELARSPLDLSDSLRGVVRPIDGTNVSYVAGTSAHQQATGLGDLWGRLSPTLDELESTGQDVIVDAGRLGLPGWPQAMVALADLTLLVVRSHLPSMAGSRSWATALRKEAAPWRQPGFLVIGAGKPYSTAEVSKVLGLRVVAKVADDAEAAAVYHRGETAPRRFESGRYVRSLHAAAEAIGATVSRRRAALVEESPL
ncbi:hypothetical protein [Georgenia yuyongxinii]|uniref:Cellulose biosynthesis protein BcsQ n=1 Tax=Georgenia yuyongxinii TaxID=2589797 RepID=A0A552WXN2_9MICO|nr:hypothetical protein [Georgenia yuyongxinii]TRW47445.1 hypothetical protein FJ693_01195 [Georgenia yuyongxinii]